MPLKISSYRYGDPRPPGECLRIGTTRSLPRGVAKKDYARLDYFDAWLPLLAPGRELLHWYRDGDRTAAEFHRRYRKKMSETGTRQTIAVLAELAKKHRFPSAASVKTRPCAIARCSRN